MKEPMKQSKKGRKSLLNSTVQKQIIDLLAAANSITSVCDATGVAPSTFHNWMQRGANGEAGYVDFLEAVTRARGQARIKLVGLIMNAAATDWRAAIALLERLWPLEYARADRAEAIAARPLPPPQLNITMHRDEHSDIAMGIMNGVPGAQELMKQYEQLKLANAELEHLTMAEKRARSARLPPPPSS